MCCWSGLFSKPVAATCIIKEQISVELKLIRLVLTYFWAGLWFCIHFCGSGSSCFSKCVSVSSCFSNCGSGSRRPLNPDQKHCQFSCMFLLFLNYCMYADPDPNLWSLLSSRSVPPFSFLPPWSGSASSWRSGAKRPSIMRRRIRNKLKVAVSRGFWHFFHDEPNWAPDKHV